MPDRTPTITANVASEATIEEARRVALSQHKSLRQWAGDAIEAALKRHRSECKGGKLLPKV